MGRKTKRMNKKDELDADDKALEKLGELFNDVLSSLRTEIEQSKVEVNPTTALEHQINRMHQQLERPGIEQMRDNVRLKLERIVKRGKK